MSCRNISIVLCLFMAPVFFWFFLVFGPFLVMLAIGIYFAALTANGLSSLLAARSARAVLRSYGVKGYDQADQAARASEALAHSNHPLQAWTAKLNELLNEHLLSRSVPIQVCGCVQMARKTTLVARFVAAGGAWSHSVRGSTPEDALARLRWKLQAERAQPKSSLNLDACGIRSNGGSKTYPCPNFLRCPVRCQNSAYEKVAPIHAAV